MNTKFLNENVIGKSWENDIKMIIKLKDESLSYLVNWFMNLESFFWLDKKLLRKLNQEIKDNSEILYSSITAIDNILKTLGEYKDTANDFVEDLRILGLFDKDEDYKKLANFLLKLEPIIPKYYHLAHTRQAHFTGVPTMYSYSFSPSIKPIYDFDQLHEEEKDKKHPQEIIDFIPVALIKLSTSYEGTPFCIQIDTNYLRKFIESLQQLHTNMIDLENTIKRLKIDLRKR